jgi:hypothetical protein
LSESLLFFRLTTASVDVHIDLLGSLYAAALGQFRRWFALVHVSFMRVDSSFGIASPLQD